MWYPAGHRFFWLITSQWIQKGLQKSPPLDPPLYWMHPWGPSFEASYRIIIDDILDSWCSSKLDLTDWWNYWLIDWLTDIHAEHSTQHLLIQSHEYCPNNFMKDCCLWILQYSFFLFLSHYYYNFSYFFSRHNFCQEVNWPTQWKRRLTSLAMDLFK